MKLAVMAPTSTASYFSAVFVFLVAFNFLSFHFMTASGQAANDSDFLEFMLNLEYLDGEFYSYGVFGNDLDSISPNLSQGGPRPIGGQKANLEPLVTEIIKEFAYEQVGHIRAITQATGGFPRPLINLSRALFSLVVDLALGYPLLPRFDPYANTVNYLIAAQALNYDGLVGYVYINANLNADAANRLGASLLGMKAGQNAVLRALLYERANQTVAPYNFTVAYIVSRIAELGNKVTRGGLEEGIIVPITLGAENRTVTNVLSADTNSLSYARTPPEILRILYGTGNEYVPGGFFPAKANGQIARTLVI
ncbi:desiccation-related protein PCC13-62-like [Pyrus x bretschneideri]|uniref:desiccation-related protein PCC13-62-like n=1 Tax=Pyrus x bretschneideri TaxID=225117 RepID=UPI00202DE181|nr:desiccation-related protein PCC13-62-like [Pyrus x bretschneideri]